MLKYILTLATLLDHKSRIKKHYSPDTVISGLFDENLDEIDFIKTLSELELVYGFEIPEELFDRTDLTLDQFTDELFQLPLIPDELYEEFFEIKFTSMKLTKKCIELENKNDEESIYEFEEINKHFELLTDRLNVVLGNTSVIKEGSR